ncbi:MAG: MFS transporter [Candidatus Eremiobacteraeota bacterium]|nr:MFS transporter [Candidatus Eremiobacteraeota bacterium]
MSATTAPSKVFDHIHDREISRDQWLIVLISGMGFFTDAYDLFVIGVALKLISAEWHIGTTWTAIAGATALLSAALGSLIFGRIADVLGRRFIYGVEVLVLAAGAVASALSPSIVWLVIFRFVLGLGIGGDYPVSATIASEYAGKFNRGMLVSLVFTMQALGLIIGPLLAVALLSAHISGDLTWRLLLGLGALPPLAVFYMRRRLNETPRFQLIQRAEQKKQEGEKVNVWSFSTLRKYLADRTIAKWLAGVSIAWLVMDVAYYGNTISSPLIIKSIVPHASTLQSTWYTLIVFVVAALPGYVLATWGMDRFGRKHIQLLGFAMMALSFIALALIPGGAKNTWPFLVLFCINYFFTEFGPNTTTFIYPAEIFPARIRTTCHGIAACAAKIGAAIGAFAFPLLLAKFDLPGPMITAAVMAIAGLFVTWTMLPEPNGQTLEAASKDDLLEESPEGQVQHAFA